MSHNPITAPSRGALFAVAGLAAAPALVIILLAAVLNWGR